MPKSEVFIYVQRGSQRFGPYAVEQLCAFARENRILPTDPAWHEGMRDWIPFATVLARHGVDSPWPHDHRLDWVLPVNRSALAIIAGYLGLFSVLVIPAPFALGVGWFALRDLRWHPEKRGRGRVWFAIVMGGLVMMAFVTGLLLHAFQV